MLHKRKTIKHSQRLHREDAAQKRSCPFCDLSQMADVIEENATMRVIRQRVSYDQFEGVPVTDHLMLVPKRHVKKLDDFNHDEKIDFLSLAGKYEGGAYSLYSRSVQSSTRSQEHLHTHLIKLEGYRVRHMIFFDRPYFLWMGKQRSRPTH